MMENSNQSATQPVALSPESSNSESSGVDHYIITIHGTGDGAGSDIGKKWWQRGSVWTDELQATGKGELVGKLKPFIWSGENSQKSRVGAGQDLAKKLNALPPGAEFSVVAHSHGGNVLLYALGMASKAQAKLRSAVMVGTPLLGERPNGLSVAYLLASIALFAIAMFMGAEIMLRFSWIAVRTDVYVPIIVVFYLLAFVLAYWTSKTGQRFKRVSVVLLGFMIVFAVLSLLEFYDIYPFDTDSDPLIDSLYIGLYFSYVAACLLISTYIFRLSLSTFWRESRKHNMLNKIGDKIHLLAHPNDEAIGLLRSISKLKLDLASPDQMARSLASIFTRILLMASLIGITGWFAYTVNAEYTAAQKHIEMLENQDAQIRQRHDELRQQISDFQERTTSPVDVTLEDLEHELRLLEEDIVYSYYEVRQAESNARLPHWFGYILVPLLLFAPLFLAAQSLSAVMGGALGRWTSNRLNQRITGTATAAALGDDSQNRLEFDNRAHESAINRPVLSPEAEEEMLDVAAKQASETAAKLVREDLASQVGEGKFMYRLKELVTYRELLHCGYFDNEKATRQIYDLLKKA